MKNDLISKFRVFTILTLCCVLPFMQGCMTPHYASVDNDNEIRQQLKDIKPFEVGNPLGEGNSLTKTRYFGKSTRWWCAGTGVVVLGIGAFFCPPVAFGIPVAAGLGYGAGCGLEAYYGGPFDYPAYKIPDKPEVVIFWFSGADEGACAFSDYGYNCDYWRAAREYGEKCVAMFNFSDVDKALSYAEKLPAGTQLIVRGHSMGGSAAIRFARRLPRHISILLLDTRDPTSWFGHKKDKPDNVKFWRNVLPGDARIFTPKENHGGTNYFGNMNAANIFMMMGRPWGICPGAKNIVIPDSDHHEAGRY